MRAEATPRSAAKACAGPEKTTKGSPLSFLRISMLRQPIVLPIPVPNAFATASLPANRAARWRAGNFIDIEYSISPSVKTRCKKRSPNRSIERWMRAHSTRSTPIPTTLIWNYHRVEHKAIHFWHSSGILFHRGEHLLYRNFEPNRDRARNNSVTDVEFCQARDLMNERDIFVIDPMAGIDLKMRFRRSMCRSSQLFQFLLFNLFRERIGQPASMQLDHFHAELCRGIDLLQGGIDE